MAGTLRLRRFRPWGALFAVLLVGLAELGARGWLPDVPPEGIYGSHRLHQKVIEFEGLQRERPTDVLFVGSSIVDHGIDPAQFDRLCAERGFASSSYNLGINGPSMSGLWALLERFFLPESRPRLMYICVSPNALNANRTEYVRRITRRFEETAGMPRLEEHFGRTLGLSHLFAYRSDIKACLTSGGQEGFGGREYAEPGGYFPKHGVMVSEGTWDGRLGNFAPDPDDAEGLNRLCAWCRDSGVEYVVVDMPLWKRCRDLMTTDQRAAYEAVLREAAGAGGHLLSFSAEAFGPEHFYDGMHLNTAGAARLTSLLATDAESRGHHPELR